MVKDSGIEKFHSFFSEIYQDRWAKLFECLSKREKQVLRHSFYPDLVSDSIKWLNQCSWYQDDMYEKAHSVNDQGLRNFYIMNPASVIAARALNILPDDKVLDMCAAPGGKSLILLESLRGNGQLWANEISANRRTKLTKVIREYVPNNFRSKIFVKGKNGLKYGLNHTDEFDKILIDAPCSGERHIIVSKKEFERWSVKRTKRLAGIQYGLLCSGLLALKPGGELVYSTCSLSPYENDNVIEKLLDKKSNLVELIHTKEATPWAEKTKYGHIHLPDKCGFGPIYYACLKKKS